MKLINLFYKFKAIIFLALILVSSAGYETASSKEELLEEFLYEKFGDRKIDDIEGLWGYKREQEKEPRFYVIIKSEEYLYIEIVAYHPIREFENQISTKIIKKINNNSYKVKRTWIDKNRNKWERDGIITVIGKFKLKFESKEECLTNGDCYKANIIYKEKFWPQKTYSDEVNLTEEQSEKLKKIFDE